ncbi:aminotransferase class I/II-fold pyridoxal phosphate-dependent enzyme [Chryseobacterium chendengshani]|uniref:aminotransferase class I/II-fold pyridoxal phosphate-dependent enzyme n=1 Tax=Chryseobacterium sp. LJ668 TaxID=2864040 RepID=UPI001C68FE78|nr:aminotransferase class I/II-fold pyridoxal phosphate-dependent enzyme [Chryseobacterium sp. LJ668]MBW8523779.1 aminotransferase class I/II-fold pyridoxal phosphate-dependent enzyme [Chryseobacterium sp. LJ668]QYK16723.1 aminotransferase class I/II-fold pyridoxal phosphate-dependent enzyme [Chryseobacterium sp. LJ668]
MNIIDKIKTRLGPLGDHAHYAHGYYAYPRLEGQISNNMFFNRKKKLVWSLNNYLGLANHPEVREADNEGVRLYGLAYPMGARMMTGNTTLHEEFEEKIADYVQKEDAFLLNYGYQGMVSLIDCLVDRRDVIIYDAESHACIIDGIRLHLGKRFVFKHNDIKDCEKQLERAKEIIKETKGAILVITEGVFGMRGDQGKLKEIVALKGKFNFSLLVDDAHGIGCLGKSGAGTGEEQNVQDGIDFYFGTFAKAFAGIGAFIASTKEAILFLKYNMRSQIFAKSLPMPMVFGALKRLELMRTKPEIREKLWVIANNLQSGLKDAGFDIGTTNSPVTPVYLDGSIDEAAALVSDLRENHAIFCSLVMYPVVPKGIIMLRLIPTAIHTLEDVKRTLLVFNKIRSNLSMGYYRKEVITI